MATDWTTIKLEYTHGTITMRELANKHGIKAAGVMRRAANEGWDAERKQNAAKVIRAANEVMVDDKGARLAKFNDQDAKIAEAIKSKAVKMLNEITDDDKALANLVRIFDGAQKIGLLALGAATENTSVTTRKLDPLPDTAWL